MRSGTFVGDFWNTYYECTEERLKEKYAEIFEYLFDKFEEEDVRED